MTLKGNFEINWSLANGIKCTKSSYDLTVYSLYCAQKLKSYSANDFEFFFDFWVVPSKMSVNDADWSSNSTV